MDFGKDKGYRPQIVIAGSDSSETAAKQAKVDQDLEARLIRVMASGMKKFMVLHKNL